jgi:predicted TIM-barrel fold metal-dependent hydrolase
VGQGVDSHCHVFDTTLFPYSPEATYRPPPDEAGSAGDLSQVLLAHGLSHALLVSPTSGYAYDNRCMMAALRASEGRFKGIARVRPGVDDATLSELHAAGVIGIRLDLVTDGVGLLADAALPRLFAKLREMRWQVHVQCEGDQLHEARPALRAAGVPIVFDHCGRPDAERGIEQPGFAALREFGREGHCVKLSGTFRFPNASSPRADSERFVAALIETFTPQRCVWGSDWPFLRMSTGKDYYGRVLANLDRWFPDPQDRAQVLWRTPARLFGLG